MEVIKNSVLNHPIISERYFFPRYEPFENPYFVECNGVKLACYYQNNNPESKTIVYFHGNGEVVADYLDFFPQLFDKAGYNILLFEFRGYGMSTGKPYLVDMLNDVECVIKKLNISQTNIILYGRSVGTIYAVHAASVFPNAYALILESGIADTEERIMLRISNPSEIDSTREELKQEFEKYFNVKEKLSKFKGKSLVLHTVNDQLVDVTHGEKLYEYLNRPKSIHLFERGNHNTIFTVNQDKYFNILFDFLLQRTY
ncbi:MAG: alpha/beta hydrolase [Bacteroidales bacterium]|nr:alpha/beta hydrolase [Bacteroidales bacterium]